MSAVTNAEALRIAQRDSLVGGRQFRAVGHPKRDALLRAAPHWPIEGAGSDEGRRHRVLWTAHHSILSGWNDFGTFPRIMEEMLEWLECDDTIEIVFMHHPHLRSTLTDPASPVTPEQFDAWLDRWRSNERAAYWRQEYELPLAATDVVLTDSPSIMTESQVLSKPIVFLEREDHIPWNTIGAKLIKGAHTVDDAQAARSAITRILKAGIDPLAAIQEENVVELFGPPGAAVRILDEMRREIALIRDRTTE